MTKYTNKSDVTNSEPVDRQIDAALAKYASVEPRTGLEQRLLANLRAQQRPSVGLAWLPWAGVLAAAVILIALLVWKLEKPAPERMVRRPSASHREKQPELSVNAPPTKSQPVVPTASRQVRKRASQRQVVVTSEPKLDQFPSPQPLSEQEKILVSYVAADPERAVLLARARAEQLQQEQLEEIRAFPDGARNMDSEPNSDQ